MTYFDLPSFKTVFLAATTQSSAGIAEIIPFIVVIAFLALSIQFGFLRRGVTPNVIEAPITTQSIPMAGLQKSSVSSTILNEPTLLDDVASTILDETPLLDEVASTTTTEETVPYPEVKVTSKKLEKAPKPDWTEYS